MQLRLLILLILLSSCKIQKDQGKTKSDIKETEQTETITKRKGDTVYYKVPKITYKDTTIYTVNKQGTTLRTVYNDNGNIDQIECFSSVIEEITRSNRELMEVIKEKSKTKEESLSGSIILYFFVGLALLLFVFMYFMNKNTAILKILSENIK